MPEKPAVRTVEVRHLQLARAVLAAIAAVMIAFSADHSAFLGLAVFSGWAITTGLVELIAAWLVYRPADRGDAMGTRWPVVLVGVVTLLAGMVGSVVSLRSTALFFVSVIAWALVTGAVELAASWRAAVVARRTGARVASETRDGIVVGAVTVLLGLGLLAVPAGYSLDYTIPAAGQTFTLTGIAIAVGVFGGYTAIVAVYLGIAGLSPKRATDAAGSLTEPALAPGTGSPLRADAAGTPAEESA